MMSGRRLLAFLVASIIVTVAIALVLPQVLGIYYLHVVDVMLINVILALGLNMVLGFGGQISLAQSAFFGLGAYAFAIMQAHGWPAPVAAIGAVAFSGILGALLGWPVLRLRGHYLALATLAFALIVSELMVNLDMLTGGANGMMQIEGVGLAGNNQPMLYVLLAVTLVAFAGSVIFAYSPMGLRVRAFRDDLIAAQAVGLNVKAMKIGLFVASAVYGGAAGVCYCWLQGYISPDVFGWQTTFSYLSMVVVGGLGSSVGAVIGAALYTLVPEWLRFLQEAYFVMFGAVVIIVIALVPGGLAGLGARLFKRLTRARSTDARSLSEQEA